MLELLDCTLRDGSNVVGAGFSGEITLKIIKNLIKSGVKVIEMGHASGLDGNRSGTKMAPVSDAEYLDIAAPYFSQAEIGMFCQPKFATSDSIKLAAKKGLGFLRVGINAGDSAKAVDLIKEICANGIKVRTSLMKAYVLPPEQLARDAAILEKAGAQTTTIMDSAGYMTPVQVTEYVKVLKKNLSISVGFHGHNNLWLSMANAFAAWQAGVDTIDCGVMGMARSVGNISTEAVIAMLMRYGESGSYDLFSLLSFIDNDLMPSMSEHYHNPVPPEALILGLAGCHSSFLPKFREVAKTYGVDLYKLIIDVSAVDQKSPSDDLLKSCAEKLKKN